MSWISVDDKLPEDNDYVDILINSKRRIVDAVFMEDKFYIFPPYSKDPWSEIKNTVTHWQPLPEPPEN